GAAAPGRRDRRTAGSPADAPAPVSTGARTPQWSTTPAGTRRALARVANPPHCTGAAEPLRADPCCQPAGRDPRRTGETRHIRARGGTTRESVSSETVEIRVGPNDGRYGACTIGRRMEEP